MSMISEIVFEDQTKIIESNLLQYSNDTCSNQYCGSGETTKQSFTSKNY